MVAHRLIAGGLAALAAMGLTACAVSSKTQPTPSGSSASAPTSATTAQTTSMTLPPSSTTTAAGNRVIVTCTGDSAVAPQTYVLTCADANTRLAHLVWSGWGTSTAHATGTLEMNNCTPNCAQGTFRDYPATVVARGSTEVGPGQTSYTEVQVSAAPLKGNNTWQVTGNGPG